MDDLISRQAAIDALNEYFVRIGKLKKRGLNKGEKAISLDTVGAIKSLPSAQPEPCEDAVSRKAVIDAFYELWGTSLTRTVNAINELPPVTPKQAETECCADCKYDGYGRMGECARCCYNYASHFAHK